MVKLMDMERNETLEKLMPPRVMEAITAGFNLVSKHLYLLLFPFSLDLFLWLGPKMRIMALMEKNLLQWFDFSEKYLSQTANSVIIENGKDQIISFMQTYNLFTALKTFPVGIPALTKNTPALINNMAVIELNNYWELFAWLVGLAFVGLFLGIAFFRETSKTVIKNDQTKSTSFSFSFQFSNALLLIVLAGCITFAILFMLIFFASIISLISVPLGQLLLMAGMVAIAWITIPALYCCHDIFLHNQVFYKSFLRAYQIMGYHYRYPISGQEMLFVFPKSIVFTMTALIMYQGLNLIWRIPDPSSWLMVVGIAGHAFISASLLCASFIYFIQLETWQQKILKTRLNTLA